MSIKKENNKKRNSNSIVIIKVIVCIRNRKISEYQRCWQSKNGDCFKDNSKFCNACGLATDFYEFQFSDDLISILRLKNTFKIITNNEFKIKKNGQDK